MSKNNLIKDLVNLTNTCIDYDYESLDDILKDHKSFEAFSKIKV